MGKIGFIWSKDKTVKLNLAHVRSFSVTGFPSIGYEVVAHTFTREQFSLYEAPTREACQAFVDGLTNGTGKGGGKL